MKDIHQEITNKIIKLMQQHGAGWTKPWKGTVSDMPVNILSGNKYSGINILLLWAEGRADGRWGTYNAWQKAGCQVRKGEKSTRIIYYKPLEIKEKQTDGSELNKTIPLLKTFNIFNAEQVDGLPEVILEEVSVEKRIHNAIDYAKNTGANIKTVNNSNKAYYSPSRDEIVLPDISDFIGTETMTAQESYASVMLHELIHWTGHKNRLNRLKSTVFGSGDYAKEELIAELGSAFLCCDLGITSEPRKDHAQYLASWIKGLKDDKRLIFNASSMASKAVDFINNLQKKQEEKVA